MEKSLFIAEKPSVARQFADAMNVTMHKYDGYQEGENIVVTWCFGHLVTMSLPDTYDEKYKKWRLDTLPFLPEEFHYEVIPSAKKQFEIVKGLLNREDVKHIYVCTDSGREGEYIYRLVRQMAGVHDKDERRVWINSQTQEEIIRGIKEAKELSYYDHLSDAAYLRAKEDYLMGMNFSRLLSVKYGNSMADFLNMKYCSIAVGRVMTCVLGMVVRREREIRQFVKIPFYRILSTASILDSSLEMEWKSQPNTPYYNSPLLYKENGFKKKEDAVGLIAEILNCDKEQVTLDASNELHTDFTGTIEKIEKKKEKKNAPLLYNLAELQADCAKLFKIAPDETLKIIQDLYEKKMVTYPRTDARVLSTAIAKEIDKNLKGLKDLKVVCPFVEAILNSGSYKTIAKSRYTNDAQITDHYAVIPTGQGIRSLQSLSAVSVKVYETIVRRFLAIFYSPAVYEKVSLVVNITQEKFFATDKYLIEEGYQKVMHYTFKKKSNKIEETTEISASQESFSDAQSTEEEENASLRKIMPTLKKGSELSFSNIGIKEGETSPPKRYTTGSIILAMENAGNLIEDEELREQIKSSGIGTSATRADILEKLVNKNKYLVKNNKTQILTPSLQGEMVYDVVNSSIRSLLNAELTASWEKGLNYVAEGSLTSDEYMEKLESFICKHTANVISLNNQYHMQHFYAQTKEFYKMGKRKKDE